MTKDLISPTSIVLFIALVVTAIVSLAGGSTARVNFDTCGARIYTAKSTSS